MREREGGRRAAATNRRRPKARLGCAARYECVRRSLALAHHERAEARGPRQARGRVGLSRVLGGTTWSAHTTTRAGGWRVQARDTVARRAIACMRRLIAFTRVRIAFIRSRVVSIRSGIASNGPQDENDATAHRLFAIRSRIHA